MNLPEKFDLLVNDTHAISLPEHVTIKTTGKAILFSRYKSTIYAFDNSYVHAYSNNVVHAMDNSVIHSFGNAEVYAHNYAKVVSCHNSEIALIDHTMAYTYDSSVVFSTDTSVVIAHDKSYVTTEKSSVAILLNKSVSKSKDNSVIYAYNDSTVKAYNNTIVHAYDNVTIEANDNSTIYRYDANTKVTTSPNFRGKVYIMADAPLEHEELLMEYQSVHPHAVPQTFVPIDTFRSEISPIPSLSDRTLYSYHGIIDKGTTVLTEESKIVTKGSARVYLTDESSAEAHDSSIVISKDTSHTVLYDSTHLYMFDSSTSKSDPSSKSNIVMFNESSSELHGNNYVVQFDRSLSKLYSNTSIVFLNDHSGTKPYFPSIIIAGDESYVASGSSPIIMSHGKAEVAASEYAVVEAYGESYVSATDTSRVYAFHNSVIDASDNVVVHASDEATINVHSPNVKIIKHPSFTGKVSFPTPTPPTAPETEFNLLPAPEFLSVSNTIMSNYLPQTPSEKSIANVICTKTDPATGKLLNTVTEDISHQTDLGEEYKGDWSYWGAIREILQNSMDTDTRIDVTSPSPNILIVHDNGEGFNVNALKLGGGVKASIAEQKDYYAECDTTSIIRGAHGEGMKITMLIFSREPEHHQLYIYTRCIRISPKFTISKLLTEPTLDFVVSPSPYYKGTTFILNSSIVTELIDYCKTNFIYPSLYVDGTKIDIPEILTYDADNKLIGSIVLKAPNTDPPFQPIYIASIYTEHLRTIFSYNLHCPKLDSKRNQIRHNQLIDQLKRIYANLNFSTDPMPIVETFINTLYKPPIKDPYVEHELRMYLSKKAKKIYKASFMKIFGENTFIPTNHQATAIALETVYIPPTESPLYASTNVIYWKQVLDLPPVLKEIFIDSGVTKDTDILVYDTKNIYCPEDLLKPELIENLKCAISVLCHNMSHRFTSINPDEELKRWSVFLSEYKTEHQPPRNLWRKWDELSIDTKHRAIKQALTYYDEYARYPLIITDGLKMPLQPPSYNSILEHVSTPSSQLPSDIANSIKQLENRIIPVSEKYGYCKTELSGQKTLGIRYDALHDLSKTFTVVFHEYAHAFENVGDIDQQTELGRILNVIQYGYGNIINSIIKKFVPPSTIPLSQTLQKACQNSQITPLSPPSPVYKPYPLVNDILELLSTIPPSKHHYHIREWLEVALINFTNKDLFNLLPTMFANDKLGIIKIPCTSGTRDTFVYDVPCTNITKHRQNIYEDYERDPYETSLDIIDNTLLMSMTNEIIPSQYKKIPYVTIPDPESEGWIPQPIVLNDEQILYHTKAEFLKANLFLGDISDVNPIIIEQITKLISLLSTTKR